MIARLLAEGTITVELATLATVVAGVATAAVLKGVDYGRKRKQAHTHANTGAPMDPEKIPGVATACIEHERRLVAVQTQLANAPTHKDVTDAIDVLRKDVNSGIQGVHTRLDRILERGVNGSK